MILCHSSTCRRPVRDWRLSKVQREVLVPRTIAVGALGDADVRLHFDGVALILVRVPR